MSSYLTSSWKPAGLTAARLIIIVMTMMMKMMRWRWWMISGMMVTLMIVTTNINATGWSLSDNSDQKILQWTMVDHDCDSQKQI